LSSTAIQQSVPRTFRQKLRPWLPTLLWLGAIAGFSTDSFSAEHTGSIFWRILHSVFPGMTQPTFETVHFFIRKTAHFMAYGILSCFAYLSWRATLRSTAPWRFQWSGLALLTVLITASLDEFHQSFLPSRTASPHDVLLDMMGALFFQILIASFTSFAVKKLPAK
jgi:VanZ family protein